jgi:hypothetical protein
MNIFQFFINRSYLLVFFYFFIKGFWIFNNYSIATDISLQLNVAESIYSGHGIRLFEIVNDVGVYNLYFTHPPLTSILIAFFRLFSSNIIEADFILRLFLVFCEALILWSFLNLIFSKNKSAILPIYLTLAFYTGHIDRGFTGDYLSFILLLLLFFKTYQVVFKSTTKNLLFFIILILVLLIPLTKYTALPFVFFPFIIFLLLKLMRKLDISWSFIVISFVTGVVAVAIFYYEIKCIGLNNSVNSVNFNNLKYLIRIDYFWLHMGLNLDRIWKHIMWNVHRITGVRILYVHIGQIVTSVFLIILMVKFRKILFRSTLIHFLLIAIFLQVLYLVLLTITTNPQNGNYGIDGEIWVPIEESRYYNLLVFLSALSAIIFFYMKSGKLYWCVIVALILNYSTYKSKENIISISEKFNDFKKINYNSNIDLKLKQRFEIISPRK